MGPTEQDRANAATRKEIAEKQEAEWVHCLELALGALGPGWTPWMKLVLVESDYHRKRDAPPVFGATVYKVFRGEQKRTENSRYLIRDADGRVRHAADAETLFGDLLKEKHPSYGFERDGQWVAFDRWTVCWSSLDLYEPKTAEQLAALRASRERLKAEREEKRWAEENPLLAWADLEPDGVSGEK